MMGNARFSDDFKRDAVHQITVRRYPVKEVSQRMGVSTHSLYSWVKKYWADATEIKRHHENNRAEFERKYREEYDTQLSICNRWNPTCRDLCIL